MRGGGAFAGVLRGRAGAGDDGELARGFGGGDWRACGI